MIFGGITTPSIFPSEPIPIKKVGIEGEDASGVISAVEMLHSIGNKEMPDLRQRVIVNGGGNGHGLARSSIRLGAKEVLVAYRRRKNDMTALERRD